MRRHRARVASLLAAVAVLVAGCSTVVDGSAVKASGGPTPGAVDVALLDPGNYPTKPLPPMGVAGSPGKGALLDAQRMADFVVGPWEVDPTLIAPNPFAFSPGSLPIQSTALDTVVSNEAAQAGYRHNFINGYADNRFVKGQKMLLNVVLRMPDPESAIAAAREMAQATLDHPLPQTVAGKKLIPGHPEANAVSNSFLSLSDNLVWNAVISFTAHGPYVLMQRAASTSASLDDTPGVAAALDVAAGLVAKSIDVQGPRIDGFTPTDPAQFPNVPRDPSGLLAKTLPAPKEATTVNNNMTFDWYGGLHYTGNPLASAKVYQAAGVDVIASTDGWVYQARDPAGAVAVADDSMKYFVDAGATAVEPVPNLPGSRCLKLDGGETWCVATAGRYEFEQSSLQFKDAHQRTAAQYILLTAK